MPNPKSPRLMIIPLGGVDEIGKNMTVIEYDNDIIVVDCGSIFPNEDMLGIDLVIPDITYLLRNKERVRAFLITHGHEDHIGAMPYILKQLNVPVYGSRLTLALVEHKLREHRMQKYDLRVIKSGDSVKLGAMEAEFIRVNHSITGAMAIAVRTPVGTVIHTGDFKIDYTPVDGELLDFAKFAELGKRGVLALMMDSTNVERPGYTMSERTVGETLNTYFQRTQGRIFVAQFASNIHRIQQVVDAAVRYNRKVCLNGRSMINVSRMAMELGELRIPEGRLVDVDRLEDYEDSDIVVITTGSQGEPMSGLTRMAFAEHKKLQIKATDTIIISANPIPGNEKSVSRVINQLFRTGANVIYEALADVHVSGHACREELKLMHALIKPRFFIPVHGEFRHLRHHAYLAESMGTPFDRIVIPDIGSVIELSRTSMRIAGSVPTGSVLVDGQGIGDVGSVVLRDRKMLSQDGLMVVVVTIDKETGKLLSSPDIISRGFVYVRESEQLMDDARNVIFKVMRESESASRHSGQSLRNKLRDEVKEFLYSRIKRTPMVLPLIVEVERDKAVVAASS